MMNQKNRANAHGSGLAWLRRVTAFVCTFAMLFSSCGPVLSGDTALAQYSEDYRVTSDPIYPTTPLPSLLPSATPEADPEATPIPDEYWDGQGGALTASGDGWTATLTYRTEAKIPDGAVLTLTELKGADLYNAMKSAAALLKNDADEVWRRELSNEDNHFFTASITDPDGNTVQPQAAIALTWRNTNHDSEQTYFSFGDEASRIVESADGTIHFKPYLGESFGYGATSNTQIGTVTLVHEGSDYMVTASYGPEAGFPAGTELKVREIMPGTAEYATYSGMTGEALGEDWSEITLERYFDIAFVKDGKELEPQADIDVQISFSEKIELTEEHDVAAVHIENNEATVIETETESNEAAKYDSEAIDTVAFTSDSFSVYGVVQKKRIITKVLEAGGNTYEIELSYTQEAEIPENAQLVVEEIPEGSDLWEAYRIQTAAALKADDVRLPGLYDISIIDADGRKVEPKSPVSVAIKLVNAESNGEELHVVHFKEEIPEELIKAEPDIIEQVGAQSIAEEEKVDSEKISARVEGDTVVFSTDGFSVYAFAYTVDFHYKGVDYSIEGNSQILLSELIVILGIQDEEGNLIDVMNVDSVDFSDEHLVSVQQVSGIIHYNGKENVDVGEKDFLLSSLEPFSTDEKLTIHMTDGTDIAFQVTDAQQVKVTYEIDQGRVWVDAHASVYQQDSNANTQKYGYGFSDSYLVNSGSVPSAVTANLTAGGRFIAWFDDTGAIVSVNPRFVPTRAINSNTTYHAEVVDKAEEYPDYPNYIVFTVNDPNQGRIVLTGDNTDTKGRFFPYTVAGGWTTFSDVTAIPAAGYVLDHWEYNDIPHGFDDGNNGYTYLNPPTINKLWPNGGSTRGEAVQVVKAVFKKSDSNAISISYDLDVIPYVGNQPEYSQRWVDTQVSVVRGGDSFLNYGGNVYGENYTYGTEFYLPDVSQKTRVTQTTDGYNLLTLTFLGWRAKGTNVIYPAGTKLHAFFSTTFEAVWDAYFPGKEGYYGHGDKKHRFNTNTVGFFVRIVDDVFDVGNKGLYTECLYTTKLYLSGSGDFATNSGTNGTRHDFFGNGSAAEINLLGSIDKALRANATSGLSYSGTSFNNAQGYQSQYNGAIIKLASFPSDNYIFNQLKTWNTSGKITVQGQQVNNALLNSDNFEIRWYVLKDQENQWHVDGMLIPKVTLKTDVVVKKVWEDDDADHSQDSVTVSLIRYKKGASSSGDPDVPSGYGEDITIDTATLNSSTNWQKKYEDLDLYDSNGNIYYYGIRETVVPSGYKVSYSPARVVVATNSEISLTATNTEEIPNSKELTISKEWYYGNTSGEPMTSLSNSRYSKTFTIYQTTTNFDSSAVNTRGITVGSNADTTTITGTTTVHPGDVLELTIPNEFWIGVDWTEQGAGWRNNAATLTRTKIRDCVYQVTVPVNASALYIGQWTYSGEKPEVNVKVVHSASAKLFSNAVMNEITGGALFTETITLPDQGSWSKTIDVPAWDVSENPYYYYVIEDGSTHDTAYEYDEETNSWLVKNVEDEVVEYGKIRIEKQVINIEDDSAITTGETFSFILKDENGDPVGSTLNVTTSSYAETGDLDFGTYYIEETGTAPEIDGYEFDSYEITIGGDAADAISVDSTATVVVTAKNYYRPVVEDLNIDVVKTWSGEGAKPEAITVVLQKKVGEGEWADTDKSLNLTAVNTWSGQFTELDKMEDDQTVFYRVREVGVGGWTTSYSNNEGISATSANKTISITNTRSGIPTNDKTKVLVQKKWVVNSETVSNPPDTDAVQVKLERYKAEKAAGHAITAHLGYSKARVFTYNATTYSVAGESTLSYVFDSHSEGGMSVSTVELYVLKAAVTNMNDVNDGNTLEVKTLSSNSSVKIDFSDDKYDAIDEVWIVLFQTWGNDASYYFSNVSLTGSSQSSSSVASEFVYDDDVETVTLNSTNSWQYEFSNLPKSGTEGSTNYAYKYSVVETGHGTGLVETEYSTDGGSTWISEAEWKAEGEDYPDLSNASADTQTVTIRNTKVEASGKLVIHKTWNGVPEGTDVSALSFTVTGPNDYSRGISYAEFDEDTQSIEIDELTPGTYHVMETNADTLIREYQLVAGESTTEGSANVVNNATATVELTNSYQQIAFGSITLEKTIRGENAGENEDNTFSFTITILDEDGETDTSFNGTYENSETAVTGASFENGVATVDLTVGTPLSISGLLEGTRFRIEEVENPAYEIGTIMETDSNTMLPVVITDRPVAGTVAGDTIIIYSIENIHTVGNLIVSKTVEDEEPDTDKKFGFTVTIVNASGETETGFEGTYGSMTFYGGVATFELGDRESATADNLPDGTLYTVVEDEANSNGYVTVFEATTSISGQDANGVIETGETETVAFINTPVNTVTVSGVKKFAGVDTTFQPKAIKLKLFYITEDGLTQTPVTVDAYGNEIETEKIIYPGSATTEEQTTTWGQAADWTDLPVPEEGYRYYVKETALYYGTLDNGAVPANANWITNPESIADIFVQEGGIAAFSGSEAGIGQAVITNRMEKTSVPVEKTWDDTLDGEYDWNATFVLQSAPLYAGEASPSVDFEDVTPEQTVTINKTMMLDPITSIEQRSFTDLPKYGVNGAGALYRILYSVRETEYHILDQAGAEVNTDPYEAHVTHIAGATGTTNSDYVIQVSNNKKDTYLPLIVKKQWHDIEDPDSYPEIRFTLYQGVVQTVQDWSNGRNGQYVDKVQNGDVFVSDQGKTFVDIPLNKNNHWTWKCPVELPAENASGQPVGYYVVEKTGSGANRREACLYQNSTLNSDGSIAQAGALIDASTQGYGLARVWDYYNSLDSDHAYRTDEEPVLGLDGAIESNSGTLTIVNRAPKYKQLDIKKKIMEYKDDSLYTTTNDQSRMHDFVLEIQLYRRTYVLSETGQDATPLVDWETYGTPFMVGYGPHGESIEVNNNDFELGHSLSGWHWTILDNRQENGLPAYGYYLDANGEYIPVRYRYIPYEIGAYANTNRDHYFNGLDYEWMIGLQPAAWDGDGAQYETFPRLQEGQDQDRLMNIQATDLLVEKVWDHTPSNVEEVYLKVYRQRNGQSGKEDFTNDIARRTNAFSFYGIVSDSTRLQMISDGVLVLGLTPEDASVLIHGVPLSPIAESGSNLTSSFYQYWVEEIGYKDSDGNIYLNSGSNSVTNAFFPQYDQSDTSTGNYKNSWNTDPQAEKLKLSSKGKNKLRVKNTSTKDIDVQKVWKDKDGNTLTGPWNKPGTDTPVTSSIRFKIKRTDGVNETYLTFGGEEYLSLNTNGQRAVVKAASNGSTEYTVTYVQNAADKADISNWKIIVHGLQKYSPLDAEYQYSIEELTDAEGRPLNQNDEGIEHCSSTLTSSGDHFTITNEQIVNSLAIRKVFSGNAADEVTDDLKGDIQFRVTSPGGFDHTFTYGEDDTDHSATWNDDTLLIKNIDAGTYTVKELHHSPAELFEASSDAVLYLHSWTYTIDAETTDGTAEEEGVEAEVETNGMTLVTIENVYEKAELVITKSILITHVDGTEDTDLPEGKDITFSITPAEGLTKSTFSYRDDFVSGELKLTQADGILPNTQYTVTETNADLDGYVRTTTVSSNGEAAVTYEQDDPTALSGTVTTSLEDYKGTVDYANTYDEIPYGDLKIVKTVTLEGGGTLPATTNYYFTVADGDANYYYMNGAELKLTTTKPTDKTDTGVLTVAAGSAGVTLTGLRIGEYTVREILVGSVTVPGYAYKETKLNNENRTDNKISVDVEYNKTVTVTANNFYKLGKLQVTKSFSGVEALPDTFAIEVTGLGEVIELKTTGILPENVERVVDDSGDTPVYTWTLSNLPIGTDVTFTEKGCSVPGYNWSGTVSVNGATPPSDGITGTVKVVADKTNSVAFNNTYVAGTELPATGGSGTLAYTLGGLALILLAGALWMVRKRRKA